MCKWFLVFACFTLSSVPAVADDWLKALLLFDAGRYEESIVLLTPLAEDGNLEAQEILYVVHTHGYGVPVDHEAALHWLDLSAKQDSASAQDAMAHHFLRGQGVPVDVDKAVHWFRLAARQGHAASIYTLGVMTMEGMGIGKNYQEGWRLIQWAADLGDPGALFLVGVDALNNIESTEDFERGLGHLTRAAKEGERRASAVLGIVLEDFTEDPDHRVKSAFHYHMAVAAGCIDLIAAAERTLERLSDDEVEQLNYNITMWEPEVDPRDPEPEPVHCVPS
jgi:hypothetical protein